MELNQYFRGILRWWWLILLSTVIAGGASYFVSSQQPRVYQTTTTLMVGQIIKRTDISGNEFALSELLAESYAQVALRQPVLQATVDSLELQMGWQSLKGRVYAYPIPETQLLGITVNDVSPQRAVAIADEIARQLISQSPTTPQNELRGDRGEFIHTQLDDLELRIQKAQARVGELQAELDTTFSARQIQDIQGEISGLESLITNWQANYHDLLTFIQGGDTPNQLTMIEPAQLPTEPVSPNVPINVVLAAAVGFVLATGAALVLEYIDDTVKSTIDLSSKSIGLTALGNIGRIEGESSEDKLIKDFFSPEAEAYRLIRTNIQFASVDDSIKSIVLTSPNPAEGKSTTTVNLGMIMAQADLKTVIIDADLRKPKLHKLFHLPNLGGLTDLLCTTEFKVEDYLKNTEFNNLQVITSGPLPPNPSELLGSHRMAELIRQLKDSVDVILFDSPPLLPVTDAAVLSKQVDGVVLVTKAKSTRRDAIRQALQRVDRVGSNIVGGILNQSTAEAVASHYSSYYSYSEYARSDKADYSVSSRWWQRLLPVFK